MQYIHHDKKNSRIIYLQNIDSLQKKSKYALYLKLFYKLVFKKNEYVFKKPNLYQFILIIKKY